VKNAAAAVATNDLRDEGLRVALVRADALNDILQGLLKHGSSPANNCGLC
jgi:hypothetical protein